MIGMREKFGELYLCLLCVEIRNHTVSFGFGTVLCVGHRQTPSSQCVEDLGISYSMCTLSCLCCQGRSSDSTTDVCRKSSTVFHTDGTRRASLGWYNLLLCI